MANQGRMWTDPGRPPVSGNPVLIQSRFGKQGNFELVAPSAAGGNSPLLAQQRRPSAPVERAYPFGAEQLAVGGASHVDAREVAAVGPLTFARRRGTPVKGEVQLWQPATPSR